MLDANAPDGFLVNTFAQDDPIKCKDYVRQKCGFEQFKANGSTPRQRANRASVEDFMFNAINAQRQTVPQGQLVATFDYKDADGALLYQVLKYDNPRNYKQRRPNGRGDWIWQLDERRVLYRLPDLLRYPDGTVFFTEGEKDADRSAI